MKRETYVITGASSGAGREVLKRLNESYTPSTTPRFITIGRTRLAWDWVEHYSIDLSETPETLDGLLMSLAREYGPINGIFHAAGEEVVKPLRLTSPDDWRRAMWPVETALSILRSVSRKNTMSDGGSIVMMSSVAAHRGVAGFGAYSASKAAIEALVRVAAVELAPRNIRVNALVAGGFHSPMHDRIAKFGGTEAYEARHPLGFGYPGAIGEAALFLLNSGWVTGSSMVVDGGYLA